MLLLVLARPAVGVNTAVRVSPVPLMALIVPLVATMSPNAKPDGTSENVKVMVAVSSANTVLLLDVMLKVGAVVSTKKPEAFATAA